WIIDGYQGSHPNTTYHVNWGWYGYYNGYYTLTALNPGTDSFNNGQAAVTGIEPSGSNPTLSEGFEGTTFPPTDWTRSDAAWARNTTALYIITGTASAMCSGTGNQNNKRLRTPLLTIDGTIPLTFKGRRASTGFGEAITVQYSSNGTTWTSLGTYTLTATDQTFTQSLASLPAGDYYLGFLTANATTSPANTKRFIIDDVTGPTKWVSPNPQAAININAWAAGDLAPGEATQSGAIFQLANVAGGTLQITGVTNLAGTEFSSTLNTGVQLVTGQIHEFGFVYEPLNYGTDNVSYVIQTNGGNITITLSGTGYYAMFNDGFESYYDFALSFPPWTQHDGDGRTTYSITNVTFPNQGYTGSFIIFNPSTCTPSQAGTALDPQAGAKGAYCFAATTPPNNDWLISPQLTLSSQGTLKFWAKSYTDQYGLERFKVLYSTTTNAVGSFTNYLAGSATTYISAPTTWTQYTYTLPQTARYFAIQCVSNDAFIFMVDNVSVSD
ncbi:MAG: choice-of-anchor J domain-containing protein, partial [Actinomycetota bacterium]|nr:choice-of-anchor J domain-containing protein [Actinomycetota bacterium]